ncbi:MAG TPA: LysR family transcriptional regulator [Candidatus Hydrogenedentes bacterium]|nr:LysR family transcriptional regulator [Candidatus Hydrogenedentota bacterium]
MSIRTTATIQKIKPGVKIWLSLNKEGVFGHGKWQLLDAIHREGSLRAAADALGISYRKAWGDLRKAERILGVRFLERRRGGAAGGESSLTPEGKKWHKEYARFHTEVETEIARAFSRWQKRMKA